MQIYFPDRLALPGCLNQVDARQTAESKWLRELTDDEYFVSVVAVGFNDTQVTGAGLVHLKGLTNLEKLAFSGTRITDEGLEHLKGLTNLKELGLGHTRVTDEGVQKLQQALPNCKIIH